jgi:hypothetical protein
MKVNLPILVCSKKKLNNAASIRSPMLRLDSVSSPWFVSSALFVVSRLVETASVLTYTAWIL